MTADPRKAAVPDRLKTLKALSAENAEKAAQQALGLSAVMEAMAMGLPVISTDCPCGGPRMIIRDHENGLLVPVRDPKALAEGICYLIEHPEEAERMGAEARKLSEIAGTKAIYEQWREYLGEVIAHGKKC